MQIDNGRCVNNAKLVLVKNHDSDAAILACSQCAGGHLSINWHRGAPPSFWCGFPGRTITQHQCECDICWKGMSNG